MDGIVVVGRCSNVRFIRNRVNVDGIALRIEGSLEDSHLEENEFTSFGALSEGWLSNVRKRLHVRDDASDEELRSALEALAKADDTERPGVFARVRGLFGIAADFKTVVETVCEVAKWLE